jgi:hypothetical protein
MAPIPDLQETLGLKREQIEGIRNPNQDIIEKLDVSGERAKKLAAYYLERVGRRDTRGSQKRKRGRH